MIIRSRVDNSKMESVTNLINKLQLVDHLIEANRNGIACSRMIQLDTRMPSARQRYIELLFNQVGMIIEDTKQLHIELEIIGDSVNMVRDIAKTFNIFQDAILLTRSLYSTTDGNIAKVLELLDVYEFVLESAEVVRSKINKILRYFLSCLKTEQNN